MNIINKVKSVIYSKQLADLELKLVEMQSAYNTLDDKRMDLHLELKEKDKYIKELEDKVSKLTALNLGSNEYVIKLQEAFQTKIDELKKTSDEFFTF